MFAFFEDSGGEDAADAARSSCAAFAREFHKSRTGRASDLAVIAEVTPYDR
jgi:hypothetical protein